jgi:peroxiredoxin
MDAQSSRPNGTGSYSHVPPDRGVDGRSKALQPGAQAPDFDLYSTPDQTVALHEFRGQPVIIAFYPADWSPVCGDQMALYNEVLPEFQRHGAQLFGISVDGKWCHSAFAQNRNLRFPLLADFEPKGAVARSYGVYRDKEGISERALFVIDGDGVVRWSYVSPIGVNPGADGILTALEAMSGQIPDEPMISQEAARS